MFKDKGMSFKGISISRCQQGGSSKEKGNDMKSQLTGGGKKTFTLKAKCRRRDKGLMREREASDDWCDVIKFTPMNGTKM